MSALLTTDSLPSLVVTSNMMSSTANTVKPNSLSPVITNIQHGVDIQTTEAQDMLIRFWSKQLEDIQNMDINDFKVQELPLARIKKIMKMDEDVKMISAEAPLLFAKAAQMFITELSLRAWIHTEDNKRRTLQRNDIATAITKFDQFDFLIDIVPREELKPARRPTDEARTSSDPVQYYYTVPQQGQSQQGAATVLSQTASQPSVSSLQPSQISLPQSGQMQIVQISPNSQVVGGEGSQQIIQLAQTPQHTQQQASNANTIVIGNNQQQSQNIVLNPQQDSQQINSSLLQQLINSSGGSSGEISAIQINADGQLQIIKVPSNTAGTTQDGNQQLRNEQNQQTVTLGTADNVQHIFNIPATT